MDVLAKIDEIGAVLESARAMPMSASCIVNRGEMLEMLEELRTLLPAELREADAILADRDEIVEAGRREAQRIVAGGKRERSRLVSATEVATEAQHEAERLLGAAHEQAERMQREVDEYVDAKLAHFEIMLQKTMAAVARGRDKLREELAGLRGVGLPDGGEPDERQPPL